MADNIDVTPGTGATVATEDIGGVEYQRVKLIDSTATSTAATGVAANPLQVSLANTAANATPVTVGATNLDIRDLTSASDSVEANQSTASDLKTEAWGAAKGTTVAGSPTVTPAGANNAGLDVVIRDATGSELDLRTENENWNAADHGILVFGRDTDSTPDKYRALNLNAEGDLHVDLSDINGAEPDIGAGNASTGTLRVVLANDQAVVPVSDNSSSLTVDNNGTFAVQATLAAETTKVIGTVNISASQTVTAAQSIAANLNCTEASAAAIKTATELIDDTVFADDGSFTVGTSKVLAEGKLAVAFGSDPDAADAADAAIPIMNRHRIPFILGGHPNVITYGYNVSSGASNAAIITISSGSKIVVTQIQVVLGADVSTTPSVIVGFGTANTPAIGNAKVVLSHPALAGGGGVTRGDGSGIIGVGGDDEDLRVTAGTITGGSMHMLVTYFTIAT